MLKKQKKLSRINMADLNFPNQTELFISENLNRHFQKLGYQLRRLKREDIIVSYKYQNEGFYYKLVDNGNRSKKITNETDLFNLFPGFFVDELIGSV